MYRIITPKFTDLKDKKRKYKFGDIYPAKGIKVSKERLEELSSTNNKAKMIIIEEIPDKEFKNQEDIEETQVKVDDNE